MNKFITRVYLEGWKPETDFAVIKPNHILVEPLKPDVDTATKGGIILPGLEVGRIPGVSAFLYRVIARGAAVVGGDEAEEPTIGKPLIISTREGETWMAVAPGEVVTLRNALVDPIHVNQKQLLIHDKHVLTIVDPAAMVDVVEALKPPAYVPAVGDRVRAGAREGEVVELRGKGCLVSLDGNDEKHAVDPHGPTMWLNEELTLLAVPSEIGVNVALDDDRVASVKLTAIIRDDSEPEAA